MGKSGWPLALANQLWAAGLWVELSWVMSGVAFLLAREKGRDLFTRALMGEGLNLGCEGRRIARQVVFKKDREVDKFSAHAGLLGSHFSNHTKTGRPLVRGAAAVPMQALALQNPASLSYSLRPPVYEEWGLGKPARIHRSLGMKRVLLATALTIACAAAFAQKAPLVGQDGPGAGPGNAAASQEKVDSRNAATPNPTTKQPMLVGQDGPGATDAAFQSRMNTYNAKMYSAMDTNGDGRVSRAEWNAYHGKSWDGMKHSNGAVTREEMDSMMKRTY